MNLIDPPTISRFKGAPLDYNVGVMKCKHRVRMGELPKVVGSIIENEFGVNPFTLNGYRGGKLVQARQVFICIMAAYTNWTYEDIARLVNKDHSTVNHCLKVVQNYLDTDKRFMAMYYRIEAKVKAII